VTSLTERNSFRFIGERERFGDSFFKLVTGTFTDPAGFTFERDFVRHPGAVVVVPLEEDRKHVLMVRQYRGSVNQVILELPAGKLDVPGEALPDAARRELGEEVGKSARKVSEIGHFYNSPGFTDERTTCFLAEGLSEIGRDSDGIEEEHMTVESIALDDVWRLAKNGSLVDAKTLLAIAFTEHFLAGTKA
jgi:8-oxo-dGTP pyrophosphatase MutT (NUDIX family)